ncbi:hypothetical protein AAF712_013077 [Marasmius tenuissimus]|uniref:Uncharacterized protein n=1 Tax=Marasmius tenuissimus TaxID=585030 RepID=A0ABR2ZEM8_9AGAR
MVRDGLLKQPVPRLIESDGKSEGLVNLNGFMGFTELDEKQYSQVKYWHSYKYKEPKSKKKAKGKGKGKGNDEEEQEQEEQGKKGQGRRAKNENVAVAPAIKKQLQSLVFV